MAELLEFRVPEGRDRTLLVWGLEPELGLEHSLFSAFSKFGPLYSVRAHRNAAVAGAGYYAIVKFYSAGDASTAQRACNGQRLFQKSPLKVCVCTKQKGFQQQVLALNSNKCQELANHYLGFNGWSSRIITLQNVSGFDGENEELGETLQKRSVKYLCAVEVTLPNHGIRSRGVALSEADVENGEDPLEFVTATRRVQKLAAGRALANAFQKILLVVLENGKVAVEYNSTQEELTDSLTEEELKGLVQPLLSDLFFNLPQHAMTAREVEQRSPTESLQLLQPRFHHETHPSPPLPFRFPRDAAWEVNELSLEQFDFEEEEVLSDLSFDDELPSREMPSN